MQMTGNSADDEENFNCWGLIKKRDDDDGGEMLLHGYMRDSKKD